MNNNIGDSISDLKWNYSVEQVYLLYEKCKKQEMDTAKLNAITLVNSMIFTSPYQDKNSSRKVQRMWKQFMDSLTWDKVSGKKTLASAKSLKTAFSRAKIPVKKKG